MHNYACRPSFITSIRNSLICSCLCNPKYLLMHTLMYGFGSVIPTAIYRFYHCPIQSQDTLPCSYTTVNRKMRLKVSTAALDFYILTRSTHSTICHVSFYTHDVYGLMTDGAMQVCVYVCLWEVRGEFKLYFSESQFC